MVAAACCLSCCSYCCLLIAYEKASQTEKPAVRLRARAYAARRYRHARRPRIQLVVRLRGVRKRVDGPHPRATESDAGRYRQVRPVMLGRFIGRAYVRYWRVQLAFLLAIIACSAARVIP